MCLIKSNGQGVHLTKTRNWLCCRLQSVHRYESCNPCACLRSVHGVDVVDTQTNAEVVMSSYIFEMPTRVKSCPPGVAPDHACAWSVRKYDWKMSVEKDVSFLHTWGTPVFCRSTYACSGIWYMETWAGCGSWDSDCGNQSWIQTHWLCRGVCKWGSCWICATDYLCRGTCRAEGPLDYF